VKGSGVERRGEERREGKLIIIDYIIIYKYELIYES